MSCGQYDLASPKDAKAILGHFLKALAGLGSRLSALLGQTLQLENPRRGLGSVAWSR